MNGASARSGRSRGGTREARAAPELDQGASCPILKDEVNEYDLAFCPAEAFPAESIAKENAAFLALKQTQGSLPLERKCRSPTGHVARHGRGPVWKS